MHSKYLSDISVKVFFGGIQYKLHTKILSEGAPHVVIGTPGRILQLCKDKALKLNNLKRFVMDECDQLLDKLGTRTQPHASLVCALLALKNTCLPAPPPNMNLILSVVQICGGTCRTFSR